MVLRGLTVSKEKYFQGQILLILSWKLRKGVGIRRISKASSAPLSFTFCMQALRILWESIRAASSRELGGNVYGAINELLPLKQKDKELYM